jgi:hypothetical protein
MMSTPRWRETCGSKIGEPVNLTIRTADRDGQPLTSVGAAGRLHAAFEPADAVTEAYMEDNGDGRWSKRRGGGGLFPATVR